MTDKQAIKCGARFSDKHGEPAICTRPAGHRDNIGHAGDPAPRIVAKCWTCGHLDCVPRIYPGGDGGRNFIPAERTAQGAEACRAAGHDVREVKP